MCGNIEEPQSSRVNEERMCHSSRASSINDLRSHNSSAPDVALLVVAWPFVLWNFLHVQQAANFRRDVVCEGKNKRDQRTLQKYTRKLECRLILLFLPLFITPKLLFPICPQLLKMSHRESRTQYSAVPRCAWRSRSRRSSYRCRCPSTPATSFQASSL